MAKDKTLFFCTECGAETPKWSGRCASCGAWNTIVEAPKEKRVRPAGAAVARNRDVVGPVSMKGINAHEEERMSTGMEELDRVLGGGIVDGSLVLASGDPGIGKSTLLLQMARNLAAKGIKVLYVSGEESLSQIKLRALRIGDCSDDLLFMAETDMSEIHEQALAIRPKVMIVDSVQTMVLPEVESAPGNVTQVRENTSFLMRFAKTENIAVFLVGHVTKEGSVAGPKMLEHMVDTVLYFEGDTTTTYRILRAVKNRFGSTNEIGVFEMSGSGLAEVTNPSEHMLRGMPESEPGSVVAVTMEGTRPILVEVQALISRTNFNLPRRTAAGTDFNRMNLLLAVLEKRVGASLSGCDAYLNVAGGLRVTEPALDLPILLAVLSGYHNQPLPDHTVAFGEVGLTGELRAVSQALARVREAAKLGYRTCVLAEADREKIGKDAPAGIRLIGLRNIREIPKDLVFS
ncbi:MAG: DNA repair protein RadA [Lachnospiraceae bacterium]|nr:DNA repair protein RadA [Lachnospiraceae bacterium]